MNAGKFTRIGLSLILTASVAGCANKNFEFGDLAGNIMSSAGLGSASQWSTGLSAAGKLAKAGEGFTDEQEYYLGRGVAATILSKYPLLRNDAVNIYVNKVGLVLVAASDRPELFNGYRFAVLDSNELNALATPGGFIFVTSGLVKRMPDEDALAAVLAHEIGHVVLQHGVKAISRANAREALLMIGQEAASSTGNAYVSQITSTFGDSVKDISETLLTKGYSRGQEYDADEYAAKLLARAGYSPRSAVTMLEKVKAAEGSSKGGWMATHPSAEDRIDEVEDVIGDLPKPGQSANPELRVARFRSATSSL